MVMAAQMQEAELGDGSNLVIILIGEMLAQAGQFSCMCLHTPRMLFLFSLLCQLRSRRC
jgi:chaperonin GroEL (HSP60 family)